VRINELEIQHNAHAPMGAVRTAVDTGVPSFVNTANAVEAHSSGRKVIVSAIDPEGDGL